MMGHINNLIIEMVRGDKGEEGVAALFRHAGLPEKKYTTEVIYPEEEFQKIFQAAQKVYGVDAETAEKAFSKYFMMMSPRLFPSFFKIAPDARTFLERVPQIHRNFPAAVSASEFQEKLVLFESNENYLIYRYRSPNRLCVTLCTVAGLVLEYYRERGEVAEECCQKKGAEYCQVKIRFLGPA